MPTNRLKLRLASAAALPALALAAPADAQLVRAPQQRGATQVETLPPSTLPPLGGPTVTSPSSGTPTLAGPTFTEERIIGPDGVETIIRTRRIVRSSVNPTVPTQGVAPYPGGFAPVAPVVFERDQWLAECERRTSGRSEKEKGGIIGGLLGAIGGGIAGNVIAGSGERLAGTLIGAGTGGLAGLLLGSLIGGGKKNDRYDCEAALDGYISQYGQPGATRIISGAYPVGAYGYNYGCGCQQQQVTYIPVRSSVRQRVIVRETVREEFVPGTPVPLPPRRPSPSPKLIKQQ